MRRKPNTHTIIKDCIVQFLLTAEDEDLREIFMEIALGGGIQEIKIVVDETNDEYIAMREDGDI